MLAKIISNYIPEVFALRFIRSRPTLVGINLTNRCNQQCIYCEIGKHHPSSGKKTLSVDDLIWIIDQMALNKIHRMALCGGEPFLFTGIIEVVAYAHKNNIRCSITSNGMTIHMLKDNELDVLRECNAEINISVDSFQEPIQSYVRGNSFALPNALKSIQTLNEKRISLTVLTVISKFNYQDLFQSVTIAYKNGVKQVLFQPVIYYSNYPDRDPIENKAGLNVGIDNLDILMDELKKILSFERNHKITTNVYRIFPWIRYYLSAVGAQNKKWFFDDVLAKFICREIYAIIDINYNGGIQPCGLLPASISIFTNRHLGLLALWAEATKGIKNEISQGRYPEECNGCCNHFSRNMIASVIKYPVINYHALMRMIPFFFTRILFRVLKKITSFI